MTIGPSEQAPGDLYTLAVGACLDDIPSGFISPSNLVDCAQPHTYEVFGSFFLDDGAFPGDDAIESSAYEGCDAAYPDYVGVTWDQSALAYSFVSPSEETWARAIERSRACCTTPRSIRPPDRCGAPRAEASRLGVQRWVPRSGGRAHAGLHFGSRMLRVGGCERDRPVPRRTRLALGFAASTVS